MVPADAALALGAAFLLDSSLGEPPAALHPVVWMGRVIAPLKRVRLLSRWRELALGGAYVLLVTCGFSTAAWALLRWASPYPWLARALEVFLLLSCFALKGLLDAGRQMARALAAGDLSAARVALGSLCSRDAAPLQAEELAGATIESLSENASDSVIAPLFYYALFGVPGAVFYRAANTLDAMVGYHGRYEYVGKVAARLDDLLNLVPARLTALLLALAGALLRLPVRRGITICVRDGGRTESPNAGWPMAMAAGLLGVRLDKREAYVLAAELAPPNVAALGRCVTLVRLTGLLAVLVCGAVLMLKASRG